MANFHCGTEEPCFRFRRTRMRIWPKYALLAIYGIFLLIAVISLCYSLLSNKESSQPVTLLLAELSTALFVVPLALLMFGFIFSKWWTPILHTVLVGSWILFLTLLSMMVIPQYRANEDILRFLLLVVSFALPLLANSYVRRNRGTLFKDYEGSRKSRILVWVACILYMVTVVFFGLNLLAAIDHGS